VLGVLEAEADFLVAGACRNYPQRRDTDLAGQRGIAGVVPDPPFDHAACPSFETQVGANLLAGKENPYRSDIAVRKVRSERGNFVFDTAGRHIVDFIRAGCVGLSSADNTRIPTAPGEKIDINPCSRSTGLSQDGAENTTLCLQ